MPVLTLLSAIVVGWLPGAVLFRLPIADRSRRAALPAEERAFWAIVLSTSLSIVLVLAMAVLHRYSFKRLLIAELLITAAAVALARFDLRLGPTARRPGAAVVIPIALVLIGWWRFSPPFEYVIGGRDPGVYMNEGIQIAQRGAIVVPEPVIAEIPDFARDLFIPTDRSPANYLAPRFMGFYVLDPDRGSVVGQFPHVFPASIAVGYALGGLSGARNTVMFWGVFGLLSVYFLGARLFGRPAATAAALLLALNVVQVWFARYPSADMVMQGLLFAAILASARAHVDQDGFFAPVAGALLGLLLFLRLDAVVAAGAVAAAVLLGYAVGQRLYWTFWLPLVASAGAAIWYYTGPLRAYVEVPLFFFTQLPAWEFAALAGLAIIVLALVAAAHRSPPTRQRLLTALPTALTLIVVVLAGYAFLFRQPGGRLTDYDAHALRTFANFYFTVPALIAALIGYALVARRLFWRDPAFLLTLTAFSVFFFYKIRIWPEHFWMARRFVPVIMPGGLLLVAAAALTGVRGRLLLTRAIRGPIGAVFLTLLAVSYARAARPVVEHIEYAGIIAKLEALADQIHDNDLVVVESRNAGSDVHVLALPLAYIYARQVLVLSTPVPDKTVFAAFLDRASTDYRRVLFLGSGGTDLVSPKWRVDAIFSERFQVPEYDAPRDAYPRFVAQRKFDYTLYAFGPPRADVVQDEELDVGSSDDLNVIRFHAKEQSEGRTYRWSQSRSFLILKRIDAASRTLALWLEDGGRPASAPPAVLDVALDDKPLGTIRVSGAFREYDLPIPAAVAAAAATGQPVRVTLRVPTWNPARLLGSNDDRDLGVMVDRVAVR